MISVAASVSLAMVLLLTDGDTDGGWADRVRRRGRVDAAVLVILPGSPRRMRGRVCMHRQRRLTRMRNALGLLTMVGDLWCLRVKDAIWYATDDKVGDEREDRLRRVHEHMVLVPRGPYTHVSHTSQAVSLLEYA